MAPGHGAAPAPHAAARFQVGGGIVGTASGQVALGEVQIPRVARLLEGRPGIELDGEAMQLLGFLQLPGAPQQPAPQAGPVATARRLSSSLAFRVPSARSSIPSTENPPSMCTRNGCGAGALAPGPVTREA
jgi:hypothetical protein